MNAVGIFGAHRPLTDGAGVLEGVGVVDTLYVVEDVNLLVVDVPAETATKLWDVKRKSKEVDFLLIDL